jgi:FkbM family methyltransferase
MGIGLTDVSTKFSIPPGRVIHAGASLCQERDEYELAGFSPIIWLEALSAVTEQSRALLKEYPGQDIHNVTLWSRSGLLKSLNVASNDGQSSSLYRMKLHRYVHSTVVESHVETHLTSTLDEFLTQLGISGTNSLLVLDLQGAELEVLRGSAKALRNTIAVFTEVALVEMDAGQPLFADVHSFMQLSDFVLVDHDLVPQSMMGDALYVSRAHAERFQLGELIPPKPTKHLYIKLLRIRQRLIRFGIPVSLLRRPFKN